MNDPVDKGRTLRILLSAAAFVVVVAGMRAAQSMLVPFLLAAFLAVICSPPVFWLQRRRVPAPLAVTLVVLGILAVELVVAALVGTSVDDFYRNLPSYQARLKQEAATLIGWLGRLGIEPPDRSLAEQIDPGAAMRLVANMLSGLGGVLANTFLILLTVIFMLLEAAGFSAKLRAAFGDGPRIFASLGRFVEGLKRYLAIKTWVSLGTGAAVAGLLAILGIDFPILWGLLAFLLNYVPNIGSIIAAVPPVLLGYIQFGAGRALLAAAGFLLANVVFGNVIEPRFMGKGLGLSTLVVFVSLIFWGWVLGPVGMLLSVPLTMSVKIALETGEDTRWLAVLLGAPGEAHAEGSAQGEGEGEASQNSSS
ncbi:membrane protein [Desulfuromonas versatilis]|uniref:Membrane protein n=1 Tax=Desulfuromonas versatilis TaxID=2802975 RepID=A0ABM8HWW7_9BACT|nr:AI-2E family transporter [Desulfuromonas versatilis]BCR06835.1 membrane protein [Desulfuromonas versatilis]